MKRETGRDPEILSVVREQLRKRWVIQQKEISQTERSSSHRTEVDNAEGQLGQPGEKTFATTLLDKPQPVEDSNLAGSWGNRVLWYLRNGKESLFITL